MPYGPSRETQLCMSLAGRPGHFGVRFHNYLYEQLQLDFYYKAFTTDDLPAAIAAIRALNIRGCGVSMPFKEACIPWLDELADSAAVLQSVNTIVNENGRLKAYNTDYLAVRQLLETQHIAADTRFALLGSGGMAKAVAFALRDAGMHNGVIVARNQRAGQALAEACGFSWQAGLGDFRPELLVNVTPIGMQGGAESEDLAFEPEAVMAAQIIFDVVALPVRTPLIQLAERLGKQVISGADVAALQALEQFVLYTGVRPDAQLLERASAFARG